MNIAIIFAGGTGQRMNSKTRPKQFLELHGKPIIVYTIEHFEKHEEIDGIIVVCLESWIAHCRYLVDYYRLKKVVAIIPGGDSGQESIRNGLKKAAELFPENSIVLIHDGVRPLINEKLITSCINCVREHGSAVTVTPAIETLTLKTDDGKIGEVIERKKCQMAKAPQCFYLGDILKAHAKAEKEGKNEFIDSVSLMQWAGYSVYAVEGSAENIKITTPTL